MILVKRWAFVPVLAIALVILGGSVSQWAGLSGDVGGLAGLVAAIPIAIAIARRRTHRGY